jgi:hypothetical protein
MQCGIPEDEGVQRGKGRLFFFAESFIKNVAPRRRAAKVLTKASERKIQGAFSFSKTEKGAPETFFLRRKIK